LVVSSAGPAGSKGKVSRFQGCQTFVSWKFVICNFRTQRAQEPSGETPETSDTSETWLGGQGCQAFVIWKFVICNLEMQRTQYMENGTELSGETSETFETSETGFKVAKVAKRL
jgi:hypothetical protein